MSEKNQELADISEWMEAIKNQIIPGAKGKVTIDGKEIKCESVSISWPAPALECQHEYVDVGFVHSKLVCKKCNKEKE